MSLKQQLRKSIRRKRNSLPPEWEVVVAILRGLKDSSPDEVVEFMKKWNSIWRRKAAR